MRPPFLSAGFGEITVDQYKKGCVFTTPERFNDHTGAPKGKSAEMNAVGANRERSGSARGCSSRGATRAVGSQSTGETVFHALLGTRHLSH